MTAPKNRKHPLRWLLLVPAASALLQLVLWAVFWFTVETATHSAGVIGGADGPTAVFVTASTTPAASLCQSGSLLLASLSAFFALQWPAAAPRTVRHLLPVVLAAAAAGLWAVTMALFPTAETWLCGAVVLFAAALAVRRLCR